MFAVWRHPEGGEYNLTPPPPTGGWVLPGGLKVQAITWSTGDELEPRRTLLLDSNCQSSSLPNVSLPDAKVLRADGDNFLEHVFTLDTDGTLELTVTPLEGPSTTHTLQKA